MYIYLIPKCMSPDDDGFHPARDRFWNAFKNDRLPKDGSTKNISNLSKPDFVNIFGTKVVVNA